ncbi:MAG: AMP-binding protein [Rectinemataceae bacterium]|nr:AMP-binding protein [Rectinemataceae bacterium]
MKRTVFRMLDEAARDFPDDPYALRKTDSGYVATSFSQAKAKAREFAAWLLNQGFGKGDNAAILGEGSPEWICGEFGLMSAGLVSVPLSIKLLAEEIPFRLDHSEAKAFLTTHNQLPKVLAALQTSSSATIRLIYLDEDVDWGRDLAEKSGVAGERFTGFAQALEEGRRLIEAPGSSLGARLDAIAETCEEDDVVTISYTSGTTGNPKGIMLTHLNYWTNCHDAIDMFELPLHYKTLLILPVDHSFAHTVGLYTALVRAIALYFVDSRGGGIATLRNIPINLKEVNSTFLFTVPAISGNFMKKIIAAMEEKGGIIEKIFKCGIAAGIRWNGDGFHKPSFTTRLGAFVPYFLAKTLVFGKVKKAVFGDSLLFCVGGGALLDVKQQEFFAALGSPIYQGYGLTEAAPIISANVPRRHKFGSSGILAPSLHCRIMLADGKEAPRGVTGEIVITGGNVMKGYFRNLQATAEALREGSLWTGDLGYIDDDDFLVVVGREKALLIAEDGEKYSPEEIEEAITTSTDLIDQIMVWCDHQKYSCALVALDTAKVERFIKTKGITTAQALCEALQAEFYAFKNVPKAKKVQHAWIPAAFQILPAALGEKDGTVNSTMKIVRFKVSQVYKDLLDYSYSKEGSTTVNLKNIDTLRTLFKLP